MTERLTEEIRQLESAIANIADDIEQIAANRLKEMTQGGKFQTLDIKVKDLSKELVKIRTQRDLKGKESEEEERNRAGLISTQQEVRSQSSWNYSKAHECINSKFAAHNIFSILLASFTLIDRQAVERKEKGMSKAASNL